MKYKVTKQYTKDIESLLAEFCSLNDTKMFICARISSDDTKKLKLIYRLYNNKELLSEFNKEEVDVLIARAQYAQGDVDLPETFNSLFSVTKQNIDGEDLVIAEFCDVEDALLFVETKITSDIEEKYDETYSIYKGNKLINTINQESINAEKLQTEGGQGKQRKILFRPAPNPLINRLLPKGFGSSYISYEDEEGKDDDENNNENNNEN